MRRGTPALGAKGVMPPDCVDSEGANTTTLRVDGPFPCHRGFHYTSAFSSTLIGSMQQT